MEGIQISLVGEIFNSLKDKFKHKRMKFEL